MNIKKPIARLNPKEMTLGVEPKHKVAKPKTKAEEILFVTKQINFLKGKRNKLPKNSWKRPIIQNLIDVAEKDLTARRKKYNMPLI